MNYCWKGGLWRSNCFVNCYTSTRAHHPKWNRLPVSPRMASFVISPQFLPLLFLFTSLFWILLSKFFSSLAAPFIFFFFFFFFSFFFFFFFFFLLFVFFFFFFFFSLFFFFFLPTLIFWLFSLTLLPLPPKEYLFTQLDDEPGQNPEIEYIQIEISVDVHIPNPSTFTISESLTWSNFKLNRLHLRSKLLLEDTVQEEWLQPKRERKTVRELFFISLIA